jgi:hypothetical protein
MQPPRNRRRFLGALGTGAFAFAAGCAEQLPITEEDPEPEEDDEEEEPPEDDDEEEEEEEEEEDIPTRSELEWSTGSDWADAQEREGVVSADMSGRDADTLALGYDPTVEPISEFDAFWPLDEDEPDADTFADALGNADLIHDPDQWDFTDDIDPDAPGLLGGTSVEFSGDDAIIHEDIPIDPDENWTIGLWVWLDDIDPEEHAHSNAMMLESVTGQEPDEDDEALGLMPNNDPAAFKIGSVNNTAGYGSEVDREQWHFHVIRYQASDTRAQGYLDGAFDYSVQAEDGEEWIPDLHDITLGRRRVGISDYIFHGRLDSPWMTQGLVSEETIRQLYNTAFEGRLVTTAQSVAQEAVDLEVVADIPDETSVAVTVHQDTTDNGESENSQTVDIDDDTESYELDGFEAADDGAYWIEIEFETDDREVTPRVESVVVDLEEVGN